MQIMDGDTVSCIQCGADFEFTSVEKRRFRKLGFDDPKRCPDCRKNKLKFADCCDNTHGHDRKRLHSIKRSRKHAEGIIQ